MPNKKSKHRRSQSKLALAEPCERRLLLSTYTVNTLSDAVYAFTGQLTLRQAVADANAHGGSNTIAFDPAVFAPASMHTIMLTHGEIEFTDTTGATTVDGPGAAVLAVNGNAQSRIFEIDSGVNVAMSGITISGGKQTIADSAGNTCGGGILNSGTFTLTDSVISGNAVNATGYTTFSVATEEYIPGAAYGGGIYSTGSLTISGSTISSNTVQNQAEQANHMGDLSNAGGAYGGAIFSSGSVTMSDDTISQNTATGLRINSHPDVAGSVAGGGVYVADNLSISSSVVSDNSATGGSSDQTGDGGDANGGGVFGGGDITISATIISANSAFAGDSGDEGGGSGIARGGGVYSDASVSISHSQIIGNNADGGTVDTGAEGAPPREVPSAGGGIFALTSGTLVGDNIEGNIVQGGPGGNTGALPPSGAGGGVYGGSLSVADCSVTGNKVTSLLDQGISEYRYGGGSIGGGIVATGPSSITGSTIANNSATGGAGYNAELGYLPTRGGDGEGGGIYTYATLTITNTTLAANASVGGTGGSTDGVETLNGLPGGNASGGAIYSSAPLTIADSTVTGNTTTGGVGGIAAYSGFTNGTPGATIGGGIYDNGSTSLITNSIVSGDKADSNFSDIAGTISLTSSNNLIGIGGGLTNGVNGNIVGVNNPELMPLGNYGGSTETMLPMPGSPVIDAGNNSLIPAGVTTDQRGYSRIVGTSVDIGSVEYTAAVSGTVYNDLNGDGIHEAGEAGLAGILVYADLTKSGYYKTGDPSTTTDASGNYVLNGLPAGTLIIHQVVPSGYRQSYPIGGNGEHVNVTEADVIGANFDDSTDLYVSGSVTLNGAGQSGVLVYADLNDDGKFETNENNKLTTSNGSFAFESLSAGTYIFRIVPSTGELQTSPAGNAGITMTLGSGGVDQSVSFNLDKQDASPLTGTVIGTSGSYVNRGNTAAKAFDGNLATFFDAPTASGSYAGLDLGSARVITSISYAPRSSFASRMVGGVFQASNSPNFSTGVVTLYTVTAIPATGALTTVTLSNTLAFRYVRYMGPANSYCNIAEAQFFGSSPTVFAGTVIGTAGSYDNQGDTIAKALDGNLATFFDAPSASGDWVGLDLGSAQVVTEVAYAPRANFAGRIVGGEIQASNSANFSSGVVTLFSISSAPATGTLTPQLLTNTTSYRYYRYIGPANSYCNIAELSFW